MVRYVYRALRAAEKDYQEKGISARDEQAAMSMTDAISASSSTASPETAEAGSPITSTRRE